MTGDVRAWARGRLAKAIRGGHFSDGIPNEWLAADAVLAVLPELLTDQRVSLAIWRRCPDMILHADVDAVLVCAAETLAGVS